MSDDIGAYALESGRVRRSFDRAAKTYDDAAVLHAEVRENLLERLQLVTLVPRVVLDAGAGTGHASRALKRRYPKALVVALDSSPQMLKVAGRQQSWLRPFERVCADAARLPLQRRQRRFDREQPDAAMVRSGRGVRGVSPGA